MGNIYIYLSCLLGSFISTISSFTFIYFYNKYPEVRSLDGIKYVCVLQVLDILLSISAFLPGTLANNHTFCTVQGILFQSLAVIEILWTGCMSLALYLESYLRIVNLNQFSIKLSLAIIGIIGALSSTIPLIYLEYTASGGWCTYEGEKYKVLLNYVFFTYIFIVIVVIWNIYAYRKIFHKIKRDFNASTDSKEYKNNQLVVRFKYYPVICLLCYIPLFSLRILQYFEIKNVVIECIIFFIVRLIGFINTIFYGFSHDFRRIVKRVKIRNINRSYSGESNLV